MRIRSRRAFAIDPFLQQLRRDRFRGPAQHGLGEISQVAQRLEQPTGYGHAQRRECSIDFAQVAIRDLELLAVLHHALQKRCVLGAQAPDGDGSRQGD